MKKIFSILFALVLVVSLGLVMAAPVLAGTIIHVPGDYPIIQKAIDAAGPGDTIMVAAGTYVAFQVIGKTNISIIGAEGATVTTAEVFSINVEPIKTAWVMAAVYDSQNINIKGINFDGTGVSGKTVVIGIAYIDSTGTITDLTVENIIATEYGVGVAIISYAGTSVVDLSDASVESSMIGIFLVGGDSTLEAHFNKIVNNTKFGVLNDGGKTVDATRNWWGDASGPWHQTNLLGRGNAVFGDVDFKPWLGASEIVIQTVFVRGIVDAKATTDAEVEVDGTATVTVARYADNPGGSAPTGFTLLAKYFDVYVPDTIQVTEIEIRLYYTDTEIGDIGQQYESYLRLRWWTGTEWKQCSDGGVYTNSINGYSGYMWAKVKATVTSPRLEDLYGMPVDGGIESGGTSGILFYRYRSLWYRYSQGTRHPEGVQGHGLAAQQPGRQICILLL